MLKKKGILLIEIFKPERGSSKTMGATVVELPLFDRRVKLVNRDKAKTLYVMDAIMYGFFCPLLSLFPEDLVEMCNKKWDECIQNNLDFISFEYTYYFNEYDPESTRV